MSVQLLSSSGSSTEEPVSLARAEAVLCDMDGTLVDSSAVVESMWASFAHDHGMSERFDEIMAYSPGRTGLDTIRTSPASRTSPPTSVEPGIFRVALQNFCWGTREMPSSRLGTGRRDSGTRRFPQPGFDTASPQSI